MTFHDSSYHVAVPLITFIRIFYPISIVWMIVASTCGYGGIFCKIFNYSGFIHISKLTYAIYLLHPIVQIYIFGGKEYSTHVEPVSLVSIALSS